MPPPIAPRRSVIVTGGASGLGKILSAHFAARGDRVSILDIDATNGPAVAAELDANAPPRLDGAGPSVRFWQCDIASWEQQKKAFAAVREELGSVDVVVANAGVSEGGRSWVVPPRLKDGMDGGDDGEGEPEEPRLKVLDVNLVGNVYSVKLALHYMQRNAPDPTTGLRGSIICTASNAGLYPFPPQPLYAASKHAVVGLVRSLGPGYGQIGIQINALAPAFFETNLAGSIALITNMIVTPPSTLVAGVEKLLSNPELNGQVAEIHGDSVTLRPPHEVVDADSQHNLAEFTRVGYGL